MSTERRYVDIRLIVDVEADEYGQYPSVVGVQRAGTDLPPALLSSLAESMAQSDRWNVGGANAVPAALDNERVHKLADFY